MRILNHGRMGKIGTLYIIFAIVAGLIGTNMSKGILKLERVRYIGEGESWMWIMMLGVGGLVGMVVRLVWVVCVRNGMEEEIVGVNSMIPRGKYMWDSIRKIFVGSKGENVRIDQEVIENLLRDNKELRKEVKEIGNLYSKGFEEGYERGLKEGQKEAYLSVIQKHMDSIKIMERERLEKNIEFERDLFSQKGDRSLWYKSEEGKFVKGKETSVMENLEKGTSSLKNTTDSIETLIRNKEEIAESIKSGKSSIVSLAEEVMKRIGES